MDITWLGQSSFRIKGKNASIVIDPYDSSTGLKFPKVEADIVTVSHDHPDHNNSSAVGAPPAGGPKLVLGAGEFEIKEVSIFGIPTYHDKKLGEERGRNTVYTITIDGMHLCHLGDLGHKLTQEQLGEIGTIDILFVPVGGVYTIDAGEAIEVINSIDPKIVIPMHYKIPGLKYELGTLEDFVKEIGMEPVKVDKYSVTTDKLPEERQLIVLEMKQ